MTSPGGRRFGQRRQRGPLQLCSNYGLWKFAGPLSGLFGVFSSTVVGPITMTLTASRFSYLPGRSSRCPLRSGALLCGSGEQKRSPKSLRSDISAPSPPTLPTGSLLPGRPTDDKPSGGPRLAFLAGGNRRPSQAALKTLSEPHVPLHAVLTLPPATAPILSSLGF